MIQGGSQDCYPQVAHHALDFQEPQVDYHFRMIWMMATFRVLLMLMMLMHQMFNPGTLIDFVTQVKSWAFISGQYELCYTFSLAPSSMIISAKSLP